MAENIPTTAADLQPITEAEMNANSVESLNNRPNDLQRYGTQGMTPAELKAWYDRLARMAIAKINKIIAEGVFKVTGATGKIPQFTADGDLVSSGIKVSDVNQVLADITGKAQKAVPATNNHIAALTSGGDLKDSGIAADDVATKSYVAAEVALETAGVAGSVEVSIDSDVLTISLKNPAGDVISTESIDLLLDAMFVDAEYDDGNLIVTLQNGNTVTIPLSGIMNGLVKEASGEKTDGNLSSWEDGELGDSGIPKDKVARVDGSYDLFTSGLAKNLQGRAASAVSADFTFRPSGGSADIGNPQATIKSIHGNTLVWNQMVGALTPASINDLTVSFVGGVLTVTGTASANTNLKLIDGDDFVNGHKYLVSGVPTGGSSSTYGAYWSNSGMFYSDNIGTYNSRGSLNIRILSGTTVNISCIPQAFDLTKIYGSGNEPTTVDAFKALFPLGYYAYNAGSLLHFNGTGLKTVGFNAYNDGTAYVLGGKAYQITGSYTALSLNGTTVTPVGGIFTPSADGTLTVTGGGDDTCIHLVNTGYRNGEYEPYWTSTLPLPVATYFPTGMKSAGSVYDELTEKKAVQRVGTRAYAAGDESDSTVTTDGTTTCYALDTPVETDVDLNLTYKVDDYGTEELLPENNSTPTTSPFVGKIHYAMNAVDKLNRLPDVPSTTGYYTVYYNASTGLCSFVAEGSRVYQHDISMKNSSDEWLYFTCVNKNPAVTYDNDTNKLTGIPNGTYAAHTVDYGAGVVIVSSGAVTFYYGTSSKAWDGSSGVTDTATKIY